LNSQTDSSLPSLESTPTSSSVTSATVSTDTNSMPDSNSSSKVSGSCTTSSDSVAAPKSGARFSSSEDESHSESDVASVHNKDYAIPSEDENDDDERLEGEAALCEKAFPCTFGRCKEVFRSKFGMLRHAKIHEKVKTYMCPFRGCGRKFSESTAVKRHTRVHTGEKPYMCRFSGCLKVFADATNAKRHEMTHTGEKPFVCSISKCRRSFARRSSLKTHMVTLHSLHPEHDLVLRALIRRNGKEADPVIDKRLPLRRKTESPDPSSLAVPAIPVSTVRLPVMPAARVLRGPNSQLPESYPMYAPSMGMVAYPHSLVNAPYSLIPRILELVDATPTSSLHAPISG